MSKRRLGIVLRLAGLAVLGVLLYLFAHRVDWSVLGRALRHADLLPIAVALVLYFVMLFGKAIVWRILLAPNNLVSVWRLYRYTIAAFAASVLAPARAGELLRIVALKARDGVPASNAIAVAVADKLLTAATLIVMATPLPLLLPGLPSWVDHSLLVCASVAAGALIVAYIAVGKVEAREPQSWFGRFLAGMHAVRDGRRVATTFAVTTVMWAIDIAIVIAVLRAVDVQVSVAEALFILFAINLSIAVPATPANVGTLQLGALVATGLLDIPREPALAFALLYHAIQIIPLLVVGFALEFRLVIPAGTRGKLAT